MLTNSLGLKNQSVTQPDILKLMRSNSPGEYEDQARGMQEVKMQRPWCPKMHDLLILPLCLPTSFVKLELLSLADVVEQKREKAVF